MNQPDTATSQSQGLIARIIKIGADPADDIDLRLQKSLLVLCSLPFAFAALGWAFLYAFVGAPGPGMIPFAYGIFSLLSVAYFARTKKYRFFRFSQLFLILLLPFLLMWSLGGFVSGSAVILWGVICPIGAMLFERSEKALRWFAAYVALLLISAIAEPFHTAAAPFGTGVVTMFFAMNLTAVSALVFMMVYYFVGQKNNYQDQSENLLLNILPKSIADELRDDHHTIAHHYDGASILFADVVDFTPMSAKLTPDELVGLLNDVFSEFDVLVDACGLEKIKTIGDCYMVASGVPVARDDHAQAIVKLALQFQTCVAPRDFGGHRLAFRIGINSGPVVAGVIGRKKFIYDLWGDAVNTASRMESQGESDCIQITRETYDLVQDSFICEMRGTIDVKGKGAIETWFVTGEKPA